MGCHIRHISLGPLLLPPAPTTRLHTTLYPINARPFFSTPHTLWTMTAALSPEILRRGGSQVAEILLEDGKQV